MAHFLVWASSKDVHGPCCSRRTCWYLWFELQWGTCCGVHGPYVLLMCPGTHCVAEDGLALLITSTHRCWNCRHVPPYPASFPCFKSYYRCEFGERPSRPFLPTQTAPCSLSCQASALSPATVMIIYRDLISRDEAFSDIYEMRQSAGKECLEVVG